MKKKEKWSGILFPALTLLCFLGFMGSLVFPNKVLDTYEINMHQEEGEPEVLLPLSYDEPIVYEVDTGDRPMSGVQLGISKRGASQAGRILSYGVYSSGEMICESEYDISLGDDLQYVYLPFQSAEKCKGKLSIQLTLKKTGADGSGEILPGLCANFTPVENAGLILPEDIVPEPLITGPGSGAKSRRIYHLLKEKEVQLKGYHIYSHDTYPFLYDMRILTFLFLAVSMTTGFGGRRKRA